VEGKLEAGEVAGLESPVRAADCSDATPARLGDEDVRMYECTGETAAGRVWLVCSTFESRADVVCIDAGPPPGTPAFTTAYERAAPKDVTWKCEDVDEQGRDIGPCSSPFAAAGSTRRSRSSTG